MTTHSSMVNLVRKLDKLLMSAYILKIDVSVSYRKKKRFDLACWSPILVKELKEL